MAWICFAAFFFFFSWSFYFSAGYFCCKKIAIQKGIKTLPHMIG